MRSSRLGWVVALGQTQESCTCARSWSTSPRDRGLRRANAWALGAGEWPVKSVITD